MSNMHGITFFFFLPVLVRRDVFVQANVLRWQATLLSTLSTLHYASAWALYSEYKSYVLFSILFLSAASRSHSLCLGAL